MSTDRAPPPGWVRFGTGGVAGCGATLIVQPFDLLKSRQQMAGMGGGAAPNVFQTFTGIVRKEGVTSLYTGLSAAILRQVTYTMSRLGVYNVLLDQYKERNNNHSPNFLAKIGLGSTAGAFGSFFGNPADVALIRMTTDGRLPVAERRNYKNAFDALRRMAAEEGITSWWRGYSSTATRAVVVNATQLSIYSEGKEMLTRHTDLKGISLHFVASMISGLAVTITSLPVDIIKTRIQNMSQSEKTGPGKVFVNIVRTEGVASLWKGFLPYYSRLGPHTVLTFIFMEQLSRVYQCCQ